MATVFETVEKLRKGEEVVMQNKFVPVFLQQMTDHAAVDICVSVKPGAHGYKVLAKEGRQC